MADPAVELAVQLLVAGHPENQGAADLDGRRERPQRAGVVVDVFEHVDRHHRGDRSIECRRLPQLDLPDLHLGTPGEPARQYRNGTRVHIRHDEPVQITELLSELAETGADLQDGPAAVRCDQVVLIAPVPGLIWARGLELTTSGGAERTTMLVHFELLVSRALTAILHVNTCARDDHIR